ncbi:hypothetical protein [Bacillus cereus]|uniref:hypothetical protein n=1 Tax=Bacillus cereus TaxID=1396 RepID=UPI0009947458|nr:hypothetical protein [Bacillus cereus]OOQ91906.1 hypothetical protein BW898_26700 [Bacillus cereus]
MKKLIINKDLWDKVSDVDKENIEAILKRAGSISEDTSIESSDIPPERNPFSAVCKAACDVAYNVAKSECERLPGEAQAACLIAASIARDACRDRC